MRKWWLPIIALVALAGAAVWWFRGSWMKWLPGRGKAPGAEIMAAPQPDAETYAVMAGELGRWRRELSKRHRAARSDDERATVERDARVLLERVLPEMMRCWLGTPWDYHGTAQKPGAGGIACGYFVATVLMDAGFPLDRYQLAKQPSENILRSFLERPACVLSVDREYAAFADALVASEPGIYLVGLDTHVGFIVVHEQGGGFRFIHSSGSDPWCVVDEGREEAQVLRHSRWRMLGNLTAEPDVIRRWLRGEKIVVHGAGGR
jgi:hypothetical protein